MYGVPQGTVLEPILFQHVKYIFWPDILIISVDHFCGTKGFLCRNRVIINMKE